VRQNGKECAEVTLGCAMQNPFSLGVDKVQSAASQLHQNGLEKLDGPEIRRDGKWSLDVYDPDGTRVEVMEFTPAKDPCCHRYTADHPKIRTDEDTKFLGVRIGVFVLGG
jgi:hypothetical protein